MKYYGKINKNIKVSTLHKSTILCRLGYISPIEMFLYDTYSLQLLALSIVKKNLKNSNTRHINDLGT